MVVTSGIPIRAETARGLKPSGWLGLELGLFMVCGKVLKSSRSAENALACGKKNKYMKKIEREN